MSKVTAKLKLEGMHCTSCAVDIDLSLEDIRGIINSDTSYPKSEITVTYNSEEIQLQEIQQEIEKLGYPTHSE
jgi:copper chaperone CopZ